MDHGVSKHLLRDRGFSNKPLANTLVLKLFCLCTEQHFLICGAAFNTSAI